MSVFYNSSTGRNKVCTEMPTRAPRSFQQQARHERLALVWRDRITMNKLFLAATASGCCFKGRVGCRYAHILTWELLCIVRVVVCRRAHSVVQFECAIFEERTHTWFVSQFHRHWSGCVSGHRLAAQTTRWLHLATTFTLLLKLSFKLVQKGRSYCVQNCFDTTCCLLYFFNLLGVCVNTMLNLFW